VTATLCDSNVWLALALGGHAHHDVAAAWLATVHERNSIHFCRATQQTLLRLLTNAAVLRPYGVRALTNREAWAVYDAFAADYRIVVDVDEPRGIGDSWRSFSDRATSSPKLWMDAYLAAYASHADRLLITTDKAFTQFTGLRVTVLQR
jgi:uncharacterized protein